jgi:hypothetical protein
MLLALLVVAGSAFGALPAGVTRVSGQFSALVRTPDGTIFAAASSQIVRMTDGGAVPIYSFVETVFGLWPAADGSLLLFTGHGGLWRVADGVVTTIDPVPSAYQGLLTTPDGALWYGVTASRSGLYRVAPDGHVSLFLPQATIDAILPATGNGVWAFEDFVNRVHLVQPDGSFTSYDFTPAQCCPGIPITADGAGGFWFWDGLPNWNVLHHLDANGVHQADLVVPGLRETPNVFRASDGALYFAVTNAIIRYQRGAFSRIDFEPPPRQYDVCSDGRTTRGYHYGGFVDAGDGSIWVIQSAPSGYGFGLFSCPSSPPELSGILHIPASAFVPLPPLHKHAVGR